MARTRTRGHRKPIRKDRNFGDKRAMLRSRGLWTDPEPADSLAAGPQPAAGAAAEAVAEN